MHAQICSKSFERSLDLYKLKQITAKTYHGLFWENLFWLLTLRLDDNSVCIKMTYKLVTTLTDVLPCINITIRPHSEDAQIQNCREVPIPADWALSTNNQ